MKSLMEIDANKKYNILHICELMFKEKLITKPLYRNWLAKTKWSVFEACCLLHGLEPLDYYNLYKKMNKISFLSDDKSKPEFLEAINIVVLGISAAENIVMTWIPEQNRAKTTDKTMEDPLKLINKYLITLGKIPKELLVHAEKAFLLLYQSRDISEDTKKNWRDNWHTIAPPFKALIDKSTKNKKEDISLRKEETLLALIGILVDKYYGGSKYKKLDGTHKSLTITEEIIDYISKQLPSDNIPHGLKKSNLIEIISNSLECWKKRKRDKRTLEKS